VTQRGNYRQEVFFEAGDRRQYLAWLTDYAQKYGMEVWAYCLMTNHVHIIAFPHSPESLARTLAAAHTRYSQMINRRTGKGGHLWQGRFFSCPLDDDYLIRAARYIEMNPVRAGLAAKAADWPWSSARAHLEGIEDPLLAGASWPPEELRGEWSQILSEPDDQEILSAIRKYTHTGHPLGSDSFIATLEKTVGRLLRALPRGRPKKQGEAKGK
jgi:putative transposase